MRLEDYIALNYGNSPFWFEEECNLPYHKERINDVIANKEYLRGNHAVLNREDGVYKGKEMVTRKIIIQYAKTIIRFHDEYLLGKPVTFTGDDDKELAEFNNIYKFGRYNSTDWTILDRVNKFGDAYEVVFYDNAKGVIKSKILDSADCYPVYTDLGEYIAFIEHWTDSVSKVEYYNVYTPNMVERWTNEGGTLHTYATDVNVVGLPIHYHNENDVDYNFGKSLLNDLKPLLDEEEDMMSKFGDAIFVQSLNPLNVSIGQRIDSSIPSDACGFVLNLEGGGDFKVVSTQLDYNSIKNYINFVHIALNEVACIPAVLSNTEVANISEMSMKMLFQLANVMASNNEKWLNKGFQERFDRWRTILRLKNGTDYTSYVGVSFNKDMPLAESERVGNVKTLVDLGIMSKKDGAIKSGLVNEPEKVKED